MSDKPKVLRLADEVGTGFPRFEDAIAAAAELRRQHALIAELVEALQRAVDDCIWPSKHICETHEKAISALTKAETQS